MVSGEGRELMMQQMQVQLKPSPSAGFRSTCTYHLAPNSAFQLVE